MSEVRLAQRGEIDRQKEIWKLCFGDEDKYIDFYYANRYQEDDTVLLLQEGEIAAMLTIIPVKMVTPDNRSIDAAVLYAIATHPKYQHKGLATQLMDFTNQYLCSNNIAFSLLVPAEKQLFDFYHQQGYREGFYLREIRITREMIATLPIQDACQGRISPIMPTEYNRRRNEQSAGRLYIKYTNEDIAYQEKMSQQSGAGLYALDFAEIQGCAAIERLTTEKILIKEILLPEEFLIVAIKQLAQLLAGEEYFVRTPAYLGEDLGGTIRPFGMFKACRDITGGITPKALGYLGLAFD